MGRAELRHTPELKEFHRFIVTETETGRLFRQEKVSMIPVTLLNPKPGEKVLDMCAAPGSKTIQILEYLHLNKQDKVQSEGFVIANDTDTKRAYMLTHQAKRLNLPALFVTCNDARQLPNLKLGNEMTNFQFDKVLCDVPCSGDGTLRKNTGLWKTFHAHLGHSLNPL
jgi:16S rRNA C967 or C1407 C5-methylase (RsmB/RsmF family)